MWLLKSNSGHLVVLHSQSFSGNLFLRSKDHDKNRWFNCKAHLLESAQVVVECATLVGFRFPLPSCCAQELDLEGNIPHNGSYWRMSR